MSKVRKVCLIIVARVLVVAAGVMVYLTVQSSKSNQSGWTIAQETHLYNFMNQFGTKMKQKYKEYNGQEPITTLAGEKYPDDLSKRTFKLYSD